ncbi:hypothetical protein JCM6882_008119 [Rhodosporidiobolus microsporus]
MSETTDSSGDVYALPATRLQVVLAVAPASAGWQVALILFGGYLILHAQYVPSPLYRRVNWAVKGTLWLVFVLLAGHTGMCITGISAYVITTQRTYGELAVGYKFESYFPMTAALVAPPVQLLLMLRTRSLLRTRPLQWLFTLVTSAGILFSMTSGILATAMNLYYLRDEIPPLRWSTAMAMFLWSAAAIDVVISLALAFTLKARVAGFSAKTDTLLKKLIVSALQTASYTTVFSVAGAICVTVFDDESPYYAIPYAFWPQLPACYGISLYTTLSTRRTVEEYVGGASTSALGGAAAGGARGGNVAVPLPVPGAAVGKGSGRCCTCAGARGGESDPIVRARTREMERRKREEESSEGEGEKAEEARLSNRSVASDLV